MEAQEILALRAIEPQPIAQQLEPLAADMSVGQRKASRFEQDRAEIGHVENVGARELGLEADAVDREERLETNRAAREEDVLRFRALVIAEQHPRRHGVMV